MDTGSESADVNMSGPFIGAIDEGTTSARFMIFRAGTDDIVCYHQIEVPSIFVKEGWCEQDPRVITNTVNECIEGACKKLVALGGNVKAYLIKTIFY
ncbi:hypothetical protein AWZ03_000212 [Drosophila navojoa]|uniref:Carbohydrate kinase FGGY N-terminal domain-containing protein n=1 Tax=Drosophila navojoa TaxID=7232 RepID=A0A484BX44_DRONA|nr:hypothetical protein AWZ03_000212 [Drosophila navojoa]